MHGNSRICNGCANTFYGGLSVADIQVDNYRSSLRNKLVAEGFYLINAIEKYGSGFIRIRKALQDYPEIDFEIKEFSGGVMVTFTQHGGVSEGVSEGVSNESRLRQCIEQNPGLRSTALAKLLDTSPKNVERWLKALRDTDQVEFIGAPKSGGYRVKAAKTK